MHRGRAGQEWTPFHPRPVQPRRQHTPYKSHGRPPHRRQEGFESTFSQPMTANSKIRLISNAYNIITANRDINICEYELDVQPSPGCLNLPPRVLLRAYVSRSIRQLLMRDIIPSLLAPNALKSSVIIEPNLEIIFSLCLLSPNNNQPVLGMSSPCEGEFRFTNQPVNTDLISALRIDLTIKFIRSFRINPSNYNSCLLGSIIQHELMIRMMKYGPVYYTLADLSKRSFERLDLISCHLLGISLSAAKKSSNNQTLVVVNCSHSYLTQAHRIIDLLATFVAERPVERITLHHQFHGPYDALYRLLAPELTMVQRVDESFKTFEAIVTGYKCNAIDYSGAEVNLRFNLTEEPASHLYIDEHTTVINFYQNLGITVNYPNLPCIKSRSPKHPYYPMEMCSLLAGQKVPIFRLSTTARSHLMVMNKPHPNVSRGASRRARDVIASMNQEQFSTFGVQLSRNPVEAFGHTLNKPVLEYKNQTLNPNRDFWESGPFYHAIDLLDNWYVVDTVGVDNHVLMNFMFNFSQFSSKFGLRMSRPQKIDKPKQQILEQPDCLNYLIRELSSKTERDLRFVMFIIDSMSTQLNRMIHLAFDEHPTVTATCLRQESIMNQRQHRSIYRTLVHKLNARLGGTNHIYNRETWERLSLDSSEIMVVGLDVTHPDNELSGVSIVGCAYTYCKDLFRHKSLVWPQAARKEIITKMGPLMKRILNDYEQENNRLPKHVVVYRDGVSHEEFERVRLYEIAKATELIDSVSSTTGHVKPHLSYIIAQKRHTMRFYQVSSGENVHNPPGGTLINQGIVPQEDREFYLYSNTSPQATARPLHYHILMNGMGLDNLQKLTYYLCFNFGKCSSSLSMPSSLRYAHNAAYDARNRVIASKEFSENKFYSTKFFC